MQSTIRMALTQLRASRGHLPTALSNGHSRPTPSKVTKPIMPLSIKQDPSSLCDHFQIRSRVGDGAFAMSPPPSQPPFAAENGHGSAVAGRRHSGMSRRTSRDVSTISGVMVAVSKEEAKESWELKHERTNGPFSLFIIYFYFSLRQSCSLHMAFPMSYPSLLNFWNLWQPASQRPFNRTFTTLRGASAMIPTPFCVIHEKTQKSPWAGKRLSSQGQ